MSVRNITNLWNAFCQGIEDDLDMTQAEKLNFVASKCRPELRLIVEPWSVREDRVERSDAEVEQEVLDVLERTSKTPEELNAEAAAEIDTPER